VDDSDHRWTSLTTVWDSGGTRTQLACLYQRKQDVNGLLDAIISLVCPMYGDVPFFPASIRLCHGARRPEKLLSPYYTIRDSPLNERIALERPNILAAYATWENGVSTYYKVVVQMDPSDLMIAPPTMFYPSTGHVTLLSAPVPSSPPPKTISLGTSSLGASSRRSLLSVSLPAAQQRRQKQKR
jgi:hypothetical protein